MTKAHVCYKDGTSIKPSTSFRHYDIEVMSQAIIEWKSQGNAYGMLLERNGRMEMRWTRKRKEEERLYRRSLKWGQHRAGKC